MLDHFIIKLMFCRIYCVNRKIFSSSKCILNFAHTNLGTIHRIDRPIRYPLQILLKVRLGDRAVERRHRDKLTAMNLPQRRCTLVMR